MDEEFKRRIQIAIVAFNFTVIAMMIVLSLLGVFGDATFFVVVLRIVVSAVVGAVAGAVGYFLSRD